MADSKPFGVVDGEDISLYTIKNDDEPGGIEVTVCELGAVVTSVRAPDANGNMGEVTLGFDEVAPYRDGSGRAAPPPALLRHVLHGQLHRA